LQVPQKAVANEEAERAFRTGPEGAQSPPQRSKGDQIGWQEALEVKKAPRVVLRATHEGALTYCKLADLKRLAVDRA
jgi:uncharacterized protein (DUF2237 family)